MQDTHVISPAASYERQGFRVSGDKMAETTEATQTHFNRVKGVAKSGYNEALRVVDGPPRQVGRLGRGYVITGAISQFIRKGSERVTGTKPDRSTVEYARKFLRLSRNMVAISRVDTYAFKIFVSETWHDYEIMPLVYQRSDQPEDWYERTLTPEESGEDRIATDVVVEKLPYLCEKCSYGAESKERLEAHMQEQHGAKKYACKHCGEKFDTWQQLGGHMTGYHSKKQGKPKQATKSSKPPQHETKPNIPELAWKATSQWDESRQRYVCPLCDRDFGTWNALARHKEWHVNEWARHIVNKAADEVSTLSDDQLLEELKGRMDSKDQEKELSTLRERHEFIRTIVADVNEGNLAPLKALSDIEAALDL